MHADTLHSIKATNVSKATADIYMNPPIDKFHLLDFEMAREIEEVDYRNTMEAMNKQIHDNKLLKKA